MKRTITACRPDKLSQMEGRSHGVLVAKSTNPIIVSDWTSLLSGLTIEDYFTYTKSEFILKRSSLLGVGREGEC